MDTEQQGYAASSGQAQERSSAYLAQDAADRSLPDDLRELAGEAREFAKAEIAFQKARAAYVASATKSIAVLGVVAAVLAFFAVMALVMGLILALTPLVGPWGATALVAGSLVVLVLICGAAALSRWRRMSRILSSETAS